jgi:hypothetical protein
MNRTIDPTYGFVSASDDRIVKPTAFFQDAFQAFQQAEHSLAGPTDRFYTVGGFTIRLRFAGPALVPFITPALEHLSAQPDPAPALTVCLWDSVSTQTQMPPPPWSTSDYLARGEVRGYDSNHIHTAFQLGADVLSMLDTKLGLALYWIRDARRLPYYESAVPLRAILYWWMRDRGRRLVHGGAVGTSEGGVLLAGKGGCGKSTTALACLNSKLTYVSDDYCLLAADPIPYAYSAYNSAKLDADGIARFPHLASAISDADRLDTEKAVLFFNELLPDRMADGFPIRAILLPHISGSSKTRLKEASHALGLRELATSTVFQLPGAGHEDFQWIAEFVKQVPSYTLELGDDVTQVSCVISDLLSQTKGEAC